MTEQHHDERTPLPTATARYGRLEDGDRPAEEPELFPGERALQRTRAGSREEMRVIRRHYNWVNMTVALVACTALVIVALMMAPAPEGDLTREIDYVETAEASQLGAGFPLSVPDIPEGWYSNSATFGESGSNAVPTWYVSWVNEDAEQWLSLRQVEAGAPENWSAAHLEDYVSTGESTIAGVEFERYEGAGISGQALMGEAEGTIILIAGSASWDLVEQTAEEAVGAIGAVQEGSS